jgi:hypothetical protein
MDRKDHLVSIEKKMIRANKTLTLLTFKKLILFKNSHNDKWIKLFDDQFKEEGYYDKGLGEVSSLLKILEVENPEMEFEINLINDQWMVKGKRYWSF